MQKYNLLQGDVLVQLKNLPENYFDAVLSDPPYGLSFMGKEWDKGVPSAEVYAELLRTQKTGSFGIHFGGTRTYHRLACNIEDAGFEIRDCLSWLYGSGFPKSYNISKGIDKAAGAERDVVGQIIYADGNNHKTSSIGFGNDKVADTTDKRVITAPPTDAAKTWDGYGTALKPAWEPAVLVMKPLDKNFVTNVLNHGCGGLNIDGCRVGNELISINGQGNDNFFHGNFSGEITKPVNVGRFPANLILDEEAGAALDAQQKDVARFFYCAKVSTSERNAGLGEEFEVKDPDLRSDTAKGTYTEKGIAPGKNNHPTLKPIALTTYLAKLLLPPKQEGKVRRILVPFSGAGSEVIGCLKAGWDEVYGIELDGEYIRIAKARIKHHTSATEKEGG